MGGCSDDGGRETGSLVNWGTICGTLAGLVAARWFDGKRVALCGCIERNISTVAIAVTNDAIVLT